MNNHIPWGSYSIAIGAVFALGIASAFVAARLHQEEKKDTGQRFSSIISKCDSSGSDRNLFIRCFRHNIRSFIANYGMVSALDTLEKEYPQHSSEGKGDAISCHDIAHIVGEIGAEYQASQGVMTSCTRVCGYGCFHGAASMLLKTRNDLMSRLPSLCAPFSGASFPGQDLTACFHGLGHGLADLAERKPMPAVSLCDHLTTTSSRIECATGVLMELIDTPTLNQPKLALPASIPNFCRTLPDIYADVCLRNAGGYEFRRSHDVKKAFDICGEFDTLLSHDCAVAMGSDFHFIFMGNTQDIIRACQTGNDDQIKPCVKGALFSSLVSDPTGNIGANLCQHTKGHVRSYCFAVLGADIERLYNQKEKIRFCHQFLADDQISCVSSN